MSLTSRLLSTSRHLLVRKALPLQNIGGAARGTHVISVPPRNKIPTGEFIGMCVVMFVAIWGGPFWIMYHLPEYQQEDRNKYTGK